MRLTSVTTGRARARASCITAVRRNAGAACKGTLCPLSLSLSRRVIYPGIVPRHIPGDFFPRFRPKITGQPLIAACPLPINPLTTASKPL